MSRNFNYYFLAIALGLTCVSCEKDKKDEPDNNGSSVMLPIPASVVDGVRLAKVGNIVNVSYNSDGSIAKAKIEDVSFEFEYATRAGESTGSKLQMIVVKNSWDYDKIVATNFAFNTDGYITKWMEKLEAEDEDYWEKATINFTTDYNAAGQISQLNFSGKSEYYDPEDGHQTESGKGFVKYNYQGEKLISSTYDIPDEGKSVFSLGYDLAPANTYNIAPAPLYEVMGHGAVSEIANLFAMLGFLGKPSSHLPTSYSYSVDDYTDMAVVISYRTNDANRVTAITYTLDGGSATYDLDYNK
ncbi:MAG: hypothetical protein K2H60_02015 [Muribaculaceae bacterium]|nr:hypothetical protein [Muribaculaceae bacterium]